MFDLPVLAVALKFPQRYIISLFRILIVQDVCSATSSPETLNNVLIILDAAHRAS